MTLQYIASHAMTPHFLFHFLMQSQGTETLLPPPYNCRSQDLLGRAFREGCGPAALSGLRADSNVTHGFGAYGEEECWGQVRICSSSPRGHSFIEKQCISLQSR